jgi:hypothetical protein
MRRLLIVITLCSSASFCNAETPRGTTTEADHNFARSGSSDQIAPWARPGRSPKEMPGLIGGSRPLRGDGPIAPSEGVFGYDYVGFGSPGRVFLGWGHDPVSPRMGSYRTDGPRVFDVFSIRPVRKALSPGEGNK